MLQQLLACFSRPPCSTRQYVSRSNAFFDFYQCPFHHLHFFCAIQIGNWNVGKVTDFRNMFLFCSEFDQPLNWDTSSAEQMRNMFALAPKFSQDISGFDVSKGKRIVCHVLAPAHVHTLFSPFILTVICSDRFPRNVFWCKFNELGSPLGRDCR